MSHDHHGHHHTVPARQGKAVRLSKGQSIKIINTHGHQVCDTWAFSSYDPTEFMSMEHTRPTIGTITFIRTVAARSCFSRKTLRPVSMIRLSRHVTIIATACWVAQIITTIAPIISTLPCALFMRLTRKYQAP